jgi:xylulokinase
MYLKKNDPMLFKKIYKVLGSKDYINFKLTGNIATDFSYASGIGIYNLKEKKLDNNLLKISGIKKDIFPEIFPSGKIIGEVKKDIAQQLGLKEGTKVFCGGVDNACMALGSVSDRKGGVYLSLGSSAWIALNTDKPIIDSSLKPYTFVHINDEIFTSAYSIFSAGSSIRWVKDNLFSEIANKKNAFELIDEFAKKAEVGSGGMIFNPSLAGGTLQDKKKDIRGAFLGIRLKTNKNEIARAALEGVTLNLKFVLNLLEKKADIGKELLICGGGSKSPFWMQIFADIFNMTVYKTDIDQGAASLGAALIVAKGLGLIKKYSYVEKVHTNKKIYRPNPKTVEEYKKIYKKFKKSLDLLAAF